MENLIYGAWGAGGAGLVGAMIILFIKRMLNEYEEKHRDFAKKIEGLQVVITELKVVMATMTTEINHINKSLDRGNLTQKDC